MTLFNRLRNAIAISHDQIEKTDYSVAIMSGRISVDDYAISLAQLHAIHSVLETTVADTLASDVFYPEMVRTPALLRDLAYWGHQLSDFSIFPATLNICDLIKQMIAKNPISAIGFLYILEGSRMGSLVIVKPLAAALGVAPNDSQGLDYHTEGARQTPARLARWKGDLEQRSWSEAQILSIEKTAVTFMESLNHLYAILPANSRSRHAEVA